MYKVIRLYKEVKNTISDGCGNTCVKEVSEEHFNSNIYTLARYAGTLLMGDVILQSRYNLQECSIEKQKEEFRNVIQILPDRVECWIDSRGEFDIEKYLIEECCLRANQIKVHTTPIDAGAPLGMISALHSTDINKIFNDKETLTRSHHRFSVRNGGEGAVIRHDVK